jgi:hypothetical protein
MGRWKNSLLIVAAVSGIGKILLDYITDVADWLLYLFVACWLGLVLLALLALLGRKWGEFVAFAAATLVMLVPTFDLATEPISHLRETAFRLYALHRIQSSTCEEFLSKCIRVDYVDDDHVGHTIGECLEGFRSTRWFRMIVIFDPSGSWRCQATKEALRGALRSIGNSTAA